MKPSTSEALRPSLLHLPALVWLVAGFVLALLLVLSGAYGFHRDELYFVLAGRHPDWGYVDQPPLTPLLSAAAAWAFGLSPTAVRLLPALAAAAIVVLTADTTRRLGGSRVAQILAAIVLALSGWLGAGHLDETATFDIAFWSIALWLLVRLLADGPAARSSARTWIALGVVMGFALENKTLAVSLAGTLGASLVLLRRWDVLRQPWPWVAAAIALAIWMPNLLWQAEHGFPQITMAQRIAANQGDGLGGRAKAIVELVAIAGPLLFPVAIAGVVWLLRARDARPWRALGVACLLQLIVMLVANGKSYYSAGFLPLAIAAGAIPFDGWLRRGSVRLRRGVAVSAATASGVLVAVLLLPVVPVASLHATPVPGIYAESVAQVGWPELARQVEQVAGSLPPAQRATAVVITGSYGQASALTLLGHGLPPVYSGHNSVWDWGRPADGTGPVILVAFSPTYADRQFTGCETAAIIDNGFDLQTEEQGSAILVCAGPVRAWTELWPAMRHIN